MKKERITDIVAALIVGGLAALAVVSFVKSCRQDLSERPPARYEIQHGFGNYMWKLNRSSGRLEVCGNINGQLSCAEAMGGETTMDNGQAVTFEPIPQHEPQLVPIEPGKDGGPDVQPSTPQK